MGFSGNVKNMREKFLSICRKIEKLDKEHGYSDCTILEPYFREILELGNDQTLRGEYIECLKLLLSGKVNVSHLLLPYVMRRYRFQEILEESVAMLGDPPDPRHMNTHSELVHAMYDEEWDDSDCWDEYR